MVGKWGGRGIGVRGVVRREVKVRGVDDGGGLGGV